MSKQSNNAGLVRQPYVEVYSTSQIFDHFLWQGYPQWQEETLKQVRSTLGTTLTQLEGIFNKANLAKLQKQAGVVRYLTIFPQYHW